MVGARILGKSDAYEHIEYHTDMQYYSQIYEQNRDQTDARCAWTSKHWPRGGTLNSKEGARSMARSWDDRWRVVSSTPIRSGGQGTIQHVIAIEGGQEGVLRWLAAVTGLWSIAVTSWYAWTHF